MSDTEFEPNAERYERLSVPFSDMGAANEAMNRFYDGLKKLREECGIADVFTVCEISVETRDRRASSSLYLGNQMHKLPILAREYGNAREHFENELGDLIAAGREDFRRRGRR